MSFTNHIDARIISAVRRRESHVAKEHLTQPIEHYLQLLENGVERVANPQTFMDIGSGAGTKVALAAAIGLEAYGIERNRLQVKNARNLLSSLDLDGTIIEGDYNIVPIKDKDIFYCYHFTDQFAEVMKLFSKKNGILLSAGNYPPDEKRITERLSLSYEEMEGGRIYSRRVY